MARRAGSTASEQHLCVDASGHDLDRGTNGGEHGVEVVEQRGGAKEGQRQHTPPRPADRHLLGHLDYRSGTLGRCHCGLTRDAQAIPREGALLLPPAVVNLDGRQITGEQDQTGSQDAIERRPCLGDCQRRDAGAVGR
jgi:hypothetical protein